MPLTNVLAVGGEPEPRRVATRAHRIEALPDRDVERATTASYTNEHRVDGPRKPGALVVAPAIPVAVDASRRAGELVEVSAVRHERRLFHDATLAKGSDIPSHHAANGRPSFACASRGERQAFLLAPITRCGAR